MTIRVEMHPRSRTAQRCVPAALAVVSQSDMAAPLPLLAVAARLALQLLGQLVDRGAHVVGGLAGADDRALRPDRRLGHVACGDRRVLLDGELQLALRLIREVALELAELLLGVGPDRVADLDVLALDLQSHEHPPVAWSPESSEPPSRR